MTTDELTDLLKNIIERLADAKDEIEGEDDDIALAEIAREMVDEAEGIASVVTYGLREGLRATGSWTPG